MASKLDLQERRKRRLRYQIRMKSGGRPRLSIFRSGKHIYAQVIDDAQGRTVWPPHRQSSLPEARS
jgi:large subunit ribosomal protein L18